MTVALTVAIGVATLALAAGLGAPLVAWALRRIEPIAPTPGLLRGGMWVGVMERLLVAGCILVGMPEGVAIVVAIKGLGRYPEPAGHGPHGTVGGLGAFHHRHACEPALGGRARRDRPLGHPADRLVGSSPRPEYTGRQS
ncbi:hypothetical protein [Demequina litorisediminis]|uniref:Uncharacterized protein n=1 Tax=Demequina litorisediminis TaxID=1849022 RepID=A0ABQ6I8R2_9MICO|nr:hypothetical protein [Demequina litorisediminis]GMA33861.1 hypothetical protein GCM10025876_00650 [Demequina litorisediminis]GMA37758.1 hypothetical protein GCM10025876_39620 [Demequina litorisediminis]